MLKLNSYNLDSKKTLDYINAHLEGLNLLSKAVRDLTPFKEGEFYTVFPKGIDIDQLHKFQYSCASSRGTKESTIDLIRSALSSSNDSVCVFDAYDHTYKPDYDWALFDEVGLHCDDQVYFAVQDKTASIDTLAKCLYASDCIWHSLIVLGKSPFYKKEDQSITEEELNQVALLADYVLLRAYDAEGYIIWERNPI